MIVFFGGESWPVIGFVVMFRNRALFNSVVRGPSIFRLNIFSMQSVAHRKTIDKITIINNVGVSVTVKALNGFS